MKPRGRRPFVEPIIKLKLTPGQRELLGEFASVTAIDHGFLLEQIAELISRPRALPDQVRVLTQAHDFFVILAAHGYPYERFINHFDEVLGRLFAGCRQEIEATLVSLTNNGS